MRSIFRFTALLVVALTTLAHTGCADEKRSTDKQSPAAPTADKSDWRQLPLIRDGQIDPAWKQVGPGGFVVENGMLRTAPDERGLGMLLYTKEKLGDCQIRVVFRPEKATANSGVFVRLDDGMLRHADEQPLAAGRDAAGQLTPEGAKAMQESSEKQLGPWYAVHHGYEIQIADGGDPYHRTGAVYSLAPSSFDRTQFPIGNWRTMVITLKGTQVLIDLDGRRLTTFDSASSEVPKRTQWHEPDRTAPRPTHGYIGLQNHDPGDVVWFKEISTRPFLKIK
jgi:hypothetical protein